MMLLVMEEVLLHTIEILAQIPLSCFKGKVRILTKGVEISSDTGDFRTFFFFSGMRGFTKIT